MLPRQRELSSRPQPHKLTWAGRTHCPSAPLPAARGGRFHFSAAATDSRVGQALDGTRNFGECLENENANTHTPPTAPCASNVRLHLPTKQHSALCTPCLSRGRGVVSIPLINSSSRQLLRGAEAERGFMILQDRFPPNGSLTYTSLTVPQWPSPWPPDCRDSCHPPPQLTGRWAAGGNASGGHPASPAHSSEPACHCKTWRRSWAHGQALSVGPLQHGTLCQAAGSHLCPLGHTLPQFCGHPAHGLGCRQLQDTQLHPEQADGQQPGLNPPGEPFWFSWGRGRQQPLHRFPFHSTALRSSHCPLDPALGSGAGMAGPPLPLLGLWKHPHLEERNSGSEEGSSRGEHHQHCWGQRHQSHPCLAPL